MDTTHPGRRRTRTMDVIRTNDARVRYLYQVHPLGPGRQPVAFRLDGRGAILGRSQADGAGVVLDDPMVSRTHARLRCPAGGPVTVEDLQSKNGVRHEGRPVTSASLADGSVLRLGGTVLVLREVGLDLPPPDVGGAGMVAFAPPFRKAVETCLCAAPTGVPILLRGETGTGKEVLARRVHEASGRPGAFIAVNCAAIAPGLFESAVFGHRRGAFTGATADFAGHARAADGGTLFLDEIGEIPPESQAKLLRFLDAGELATVGAVRPGTADVRVVAATNVNLEEAIQRGTFRGDLYARLMGCEVRLPPLRERPEDVLLLAAGVAAEAGAALTADAAEALALHRWPFNVRELLAVVREAARAAEDGTIPLAALPEALRARLLLISSGTPAARTGDTMAPPREPVPTREDLETLLREVGGNVSEAARRLHRDRRQVYRWMDRYGLKEADNGV